MQWFEVDDVSFESWSFFSLLGWCVGWDGRGGEGEGEGFGVV